MNGPRAGKILIRGVNWVGDAVMSMPAVRAVKKAFPGSTTTLLVKPWVSPLFEKDPSVDEIFLYGDEYGGLAGKLRLSRRLRERGFDIAVLLQNAFDAALIAFLAGVPETIGYKRDGRGFLLTKPVKIGKDERRMPHVEYYLELLRRAGIEAPYSEPWIYLTPDERLGARKALSGLKRPVIGINPGAAYGSSKRWHPERFAETAKMAMEGLGGSTVIFGGEKETEIAREIMGYLKEAKHKERLLSFSGKTTLRELSALISESDALISNDSGPMHIGYAVKTPVLAIFGSTDPRHTGPRGIGDVVIKKDLPCSPCFERKCRHEGLRCMEEIGTEEVFSALRGLLPKGRAVFFDRDGTIIKDAVYLNKWEDFEIFPDASEVTKLKDRGFKLIGVTNQSGIARGIVDEAFVKEVNGLLIKKLGLDGFYHCPHHPDEKCPCRKPGPFFPLRARAEHGVDLKGSYFVGDKPSDIALARAVGGRAVFVGRPGEEGAEDADFAAPGLGEAVRWIISDSD